MTGPTSRERRRRILTVIAIEAAVVAAIIGCLVAAHTHDHLLGVISLLIALVANVAVWNFARHRPR